jgi:hypothetical protein
MEQCIRAILFLQNVHRVLSTTTGDDDYDAAAAAADDDDDKPRMCSQT